MTTVIRKWSSIPALSTSAVALALLLAMGVPTEARPTRQQQKAYLRRCLITWRHRRLYLFHTIPNLEIVTEDKQKLALASSGTVTLDRPDKARVTRHGGFADIEAVFDGKTLTLFGKNSDLYAQVDAIRHYRPFGRRVAGQIP